MRKMNILASVMALGFLVGCGGGSGSSNTGENNNGTRLDNEKLSDGKNKDGFYGENVLFGKTKIVGTWRVSDEEDTQDYKFLSDGTKIFVGGFLDGASTEYGVSKNGKVISDDYVGELWTLVKNRSGDCYDIEISHKNGSLSSSVFCKQR